MIRSWLWKVLAGALSVVSLFAWQAQRGKEKAREKAREAEIKAKGEKEARKHVQRTVEVTREVEDAINRTAPDLARSKLREYATGSRD